MLTIRQTERRLAVIANWGLFGTFGLGLILSGVNGGTIALGLLGFALILVGFIAQVIINQVYGRGFTPGEVALGFIGFGIAVLGFVASWIFDPTFGTTDIVVGLSGFAAIIVAFLVYLVTRYGLKGSFSMFHHRGRH
ncbi:MAG TPA: hypothetical protein VHA10_17815 [Hypericibacter adhaerens]|jgi:hypothetical protein|uniref:Uncharacterized protein n=1 Tax=Hypericibacter adhaerens TaxID=2602016 RepID=A0A5J6MSU2_9PROT|nr:hypothetical protein [Hypericibacter adhaerens]QEX20658.1 hypothetical protein FRZ61_05770 [Hypericibacter adhaerens]HWA45082.1 hypothetical protein [Hypericibacter adhaerens]